MPADMSSYTPGPLGPSTWTPPPGYAEGEASQDPYAYTGGSLMTPWTGQFNSGGYGGVVTPGYTPFSFGQFNYAQPNVGSFGERYNDPAAFRFADFNGPSAFQAPTAEQMKADPGYQARMDAMQKATTAAAAHSGALRTGGFARDMAGKLGDLASQEYGNTYNRALQTWNTNWGQAKDIYGINQGNTKQAFDTNTANLLAAHQQRAQDWGQNANVGLQQAQLGYNIASGAWDRNEQLAAFQWQNDQNYRNQLAAAQTQNNMLGYQRGLADYQAAQNTFYTNQDRQYNMLSGQENTGLNATNAYGNQLASAYGGYGNAGMGGANAQAGAATAGGNAWGGFAGGLGNMFGGMAMYGAAQPGSPQRPQVQTPNISYTTGWGNSMPGQAFYNYGYGAPYSGMPSYPGGQAVG